MREFVGFMREFSNFKRGFSNLMRAIGHLMRGNSPFMRILAIPAHTEGIRTTHRDKQRPEKWDTRTGPLSQSLVPTSSHPRPTGTNTF